MGDGLKLNRTWVLPARLDVEPNIGNVGALQLNRYCSEKEDSGQQFLACVMENNIVRENSLFS